MPPPPILQPPGTVAAPLRRRTIAPAERKDARANNAHMLSRQLRRVIADAPGETPSHAVAPQIFATVEMHRNATMETARNAPAAISRYTAIVDVPITPVVHLATAMHVIALTNRAVAAVVQKTIVRKVKTVAQPVGAQPQIAQREHAAGLQTRHRAPVKAPAIAAVLRNRPVIVPLADQEMAAFHVAVRPIQKL